MLIGLGMLLVGAAFPLANTGVVPIIGLLFAALSPNVWLLGVGMLSFGIAGLFLRNTWLLFSVGSMLTIAAGLNTRLPALLEDVLGGAPSTMRVSVVLEGEVGQAIHIESAQPSISARRGGYAHARPACYGDGCLATRGFEAPSRFRDYWTENVSDVVRSLGLTVAQPGESAPILSVKSTTQGRFVLISLVLKDDKGTLLSQLDRRYRNSVAGEARDDTRSNSYSLQLVTEYLLHGNAIASAAAVLLPSSPAYPIDAFLREAIRLTHPQGTQLGLRGLAPRGEPAAASTPVQLELLAEEVYEPARVFNSQDPGYVTSDWARRSWDQVRDARCREMLVPELKDAPQLQTWHLFTKDASGRKKVRYTGPALCDEDAVWLFDLAVEKDRTVIAKYSPEGNLAYRASFPKPASPNGSDGWVMLGSWRADNGAVTFDWEISSRSGYEQRVQRVLTLRFNEPVPR